VIQFVLAMLEELEPAALAELERALGRLLAPADPTPAKRRVARLGFLAGLIDEHATPRLPRVPRELYDELRPADAPLSDRLVKEFGSWLKTCRAAHGVLPDGRVRRPDGNGATRTPGPSVRVAAYSADEIAHAIRACALRLGRRPTARAYERWRLQQLKASRSGGSEPPRLPSYNTITKRCSTWGTAVARAMLRDGELENARAARAPQMKPKHTFSAGDLAEAAGAKVAPPLMRQGRLDHKKAAALPLPDAAELARALNCSLEHLAGETGERGVPPAAGAAISSDTVKRRLVGTELTQTQILRQLGLPLGIYRRMLNGNAQPTLRVAIAIAALTGTPLSALIV
jgi:hypothetical protein